MAGAPGGPPAILYGDAGEPAGRIRGIPGETPGTVSGTEGGGVMQADGFITCSTCGLTKPVTDLYYKRRSPTSSRRSSVCKVCEKIRSKDYWARIKVEEPEKYRAMLDRCNSRNRVMHGHG